eukprot:GHVP01027400.1.p1 GENE.GHVP01027400.1~~GHVP01027400.1.p1  ORF type:complete len:828 (+),score=162.71 GHVP01027400.1:229-2484(+)
MHDNLITSENPSHGDFDNILSEEDIDMIEKEARSGPLTETVSREKIQVWIAKEFRSTLTSLVDSNGFSIYYEEIKRMCGENRQSLMINFQHLSDGSKLLGDYIMEAPEETFKIMDFELGKVVRSLFEDYDKVFEEVHVKIVGTTVIDELCNLRNDNINTLVRIRGVVTRRSVVFPQLRLVKYTCGKCGRLIGPIYQEVHKENKPNSCTECGGKGPFTISVDNTSYRNYQTIRLQESPGKVIAGRLPRSKEVILIRDLVDSVKPGEEVEIIGIYKNNYSRQLNLQNGFPVFSTAIEAHSVIKDENYLSSFGLTDDDKQSIKELSRDPKIVERLTNAIAPSIFGHKDIKRAVCLALFGGQEKNIQGKHRVRGDINVLLLGDPGTAKSQFLRYVSKTAYRAVLATGQGASAVGLTASVRRDTVTKEWTLEGGALVLADRGVCLIDEFDKMNDEDRTSIHEAMEQQSISISKAGIVASLQARCSIIAAANPIRGTYNQSIVLSQNVNLTEPILSRFDILCVVKDRVDRIEDERVGEFVVQSHINSHEFANEDMKNIKTIGDDINQELFKKYIVYARQNIRPIISEIDIEKISRLYSDLRKESMTSGGVPITVRHLESMVRIAEARARMCLRDTVRSEDVDYAVYVGLESFIGAQRYSVMKEMQKRFSKYLRHSRDNIELLFFCLQELVRENLQFQKSRSNSADFVASKFEIPVDTFEERAKKIGIIGTAFFYNSGVFKENGFIMDSSRNTISKMF